MEYLLQLVSEGDFCSLLFLILILCFVGQYMVAARPDLRYWGLRLAAGAFVLYGAYQVVTIGTPEAGELVWIAFRGLLAAGLMLGVSWVILPVGAFLYELDKEGVRRRDEKRRRAREAVERERRLAAESARAAERTRYEQKMQAARCQAEEQKRRREQFEKTRRDEARYQCQLLYDRHAGELERSFPPERLDAYFTQYLSDAHPPELVEQRAARLKDMIEEYVGETPTNQPTFRSIRDISEYYRQHRLEVQALDYDEDMKESLIASINRQEEAVIRRFLEP